MVTLKSSKMAAKLILALVIAVVIVVQCNAFNSQPYRNIMVTVTSTWLHQISYLFFRERSKLIESKQLLQIESEIFRKLFSSHVWETWSSVVTAGEFQELLGLLLLL